MVWILMLSVALNAFLAGFIFGSVQGAENLYVRKESKEEGGTSEVSGGGTTQDPEAEEDDSEHPPVLIGFHMEKNGK